MPIVSLERPDAYPLVLDLEAGRVGFVRLDEAAYRSASFLDERLLVGAPPPAWRAWPEVRYAALGLPGRCDFIFHTGHVGSTLVSRLLGDSARVFSLREPAILRTLARMDVSLGDTRESLEGEAFETTLLAFLKLWARTWRPGQKALVKATSFAGEMAPLLMRLSPISRAILMFVSPIAYMETILAGPNSRVELEALAASRLARLHRHIGVEAWRLADLGEGERAAMSWTCEILALARAADDFGERTQWLDFDRFLADPARTLGSALAHLYGDAAAGEAAALLAGPHMNRYSKSPGQAYDADLRRRVLAQARRDHGETIEAGIAWLNAASDRHPRIGAAIRSVAAARRR